MNPFLWFALAVIVFVLVSGLAFALRAPKPHSNRKLQAVRSEYLSGKGKKRISLYRGPRSPLM